MLCSRMLLYSMDEWHNENLPLSILLYHFDVPGSKAYLTLVLPLRCKDLLQGVLSGWLQSRLKNGWKRIGTDPRKGWNQIAWKHVNTAKEPEYLSISRRRGCNNSQNRNSTGAIVSDSVEVTSVRGQICWQSGANLLSWYHFQAFTYSQLVDFKDFKEMYVQCNC